MELSRHSEGPFSILGRPSMQCCYWFRAKWEEGELTKQISTSCRSAGKLKEELNHNCKLFFFIYLM